MTSPIRKTRYTRDNIEALLDREVKIEAFKFLSSNDLSQGSPTYCLVWKIDSKLKVTILDNFTEKVVNEYNFTPETVYVEGHGWANHVIHSDILNYFEYSYPNYEVQKVRICYEIARVQNSQLMR